METIELKDVMNQLPVVENLKNFAGVDAQNALSMMTPERLAAVVGALNIKHIGKFDFNKRIPQGFYWCSNLGAETINPPSSEFIACVILSFGSCELIIGVDIRFYCGRYTSSAGVLGNWNIFLQ